MHIILFILIASLIIEQLGQNFIYKKFDFIIDIFGNLNGTLFYLCGSLAILLSVLILWKNLKNKKFKLQKWDICFMLLLAWGLISVLLAKDKELAVIGSHRMDGYFSYAIYAAVYVGVRTLKNEKIKLWLIRSLSIAATFLCFDFIIKGSDTSIFFNRNHFAYLLTLSTMLLAGLFTYATKLWIKVIYLILFSINLFTLINADTLGSYLAVLFGMGFLFVFMLISKKEKNFMISSVILIILFITISIAVDHQTHILRKSFNVFGNDLEKIATNAEDADMAGSFRIKLWKHSFVYIKEKPLFGYGPEGTYNAWLFEDDMGNDRPHNEYIQCALFMGIPAALFYLTGLFMLFFHCIKNRKQLPSYAIISGVAVFAYCISAFFGNTMFYTTPYFFMMLGMLYQNNR